jgi:hypothetical protein
MHIFHFGSKRPEERGYPDHSAQDLDWQRSGKIILKCYPPSLIAVCNMLFLEKSIFDDFRKEGMFHRCRPESQFQYRKNQNYAYIMHTT